MSEGPVLAFLRSGWGVVPWCVVTLGWWVQYLAGQREQRRLKARGRELDVELETLHEAMQAVGPTDPGGPELLERLNGHTAARVELAQSFHELERRSHVWQAVVAGALVYALMRVAVTW